MDKIKSLQLEKELKNQSVSGFKVIELINNGKSAAVFKAEKDGDLYALKVFDNELIERFGHEIQTKRIEQEISLKNHSIDNLVKIYEGGNTIVGKENFYFIVMELIDGLNLKDYIESQDYSEGFILKVLESLFNTTEQLLKKEIAHRDIKPENIMVDKKGNIILMDLGVLKLVGAKSFSDEEEKSFVGTLRYAAPEFLQRIEEDSIEGWRAVNIYQIGATLHDLIMKNELFIEKTPYSNLVIAIKDDNPKISNNELSFDLLQISRDMLTKNWRKRLQLVYKERIDNVVVAKIYDEDSFESSIEEILKMRIGHLAKFEEIEGLKRSKKELLEKRKNVGLQLAATIEKSFKKIEDKGVFISHKKSTNFAFNNDSQNEKLIQNYLYELKGEMKIGFPTNLYVLIRISNDEDSLTDIETVGIFPSAFARANLSSPLKFFEEIYSDKRLGVRINAYGQTPVLFNFKTINIFKGVVEFDDSFINHLSNQLAKIISKALAGVQAYVEGQLKIQEQMATSKKSFNSSVSQGLKSTIIDAL